MNHGRAEDILLRFEIRNFHDMGERINHSSSFKVFEVKKRSRHLLVHLLLDHPLKFNALMKSDRVKRELGRKMREDLVARQPEGAELAEQYTGDILEILTHGFPLNTGKAWHQTSPYRTRSMDAFAFENAGIIAYSEDNVTPTVYTRTNVGKFLDR